MGAFPQPGPGPGPLPGVITIGQTQVNGGADGDLLTKNVNILGGNPFKVDTVLWSALPAPGNVGRLLRVSDYGTKGALVMDDGVRWRPISSQALLATYDQDSANIGATETIIFSYQIPAALLFTNDRLRIFASYSKSGGVDAGMSKFRLGTTGTLSDPIIGDFSVMVQTANRSAAIVTDFRIFSATGIRRVTNSGNTGTSGGYSNQSGSGGPYILTPVTIPNISNSLFFTAAINSAGATDTVNLHDAQLYHIVAAN